MTWWVSTLAQLEEAIDFHLANGEFVIDVETRGQYPLDPRRNEVYWIVLAGPGGRVDVIPFGHPIGEQNGTTKEPRLCTDGKIRRYTVPTFGPPPKQLKPGVVMAALRRLLFSKCLKIGHNIKFDLESLFKYYGEDIPGPYADTWAVFLLNENRHDYRLGPVVERMFKHKLDKSISGVLDKTAFSKVLRYVYRDGRYTWLVWRVVEQALHDEGLWKLFEFEMDVLAGLLDTERVGIMLDRERLEKLDIELDEQLEVARGQLWKLAGREWNFNSPKQRVEVFYGPKKAGGQGLKCKKFTDKGGMSCDDEALTYHIGNPLVDAYREYQDLDKISGTYVKAWLGTGTAKKSKDKNNAPPLNPDTGRIHANFKQFGTVTGRFSCSEPNLQNIPSSETELGKQMRDLFIAAPGTLLVCADYAQIEYAFMAHYSRDPVLVRAFEEEQDFHLYVAGFLLDKPLEEVTKGERKLTKNTNFAVAYGAGDEKVAAMSGVSIEHAKWFRKKHRALLPDLYRFTDNVVRTCRKRKPAYVKTVMGRRRRLPAIHWSNDSLRLGAERQAVNSVIQGSAADLQKLAMIRVNDMRDPDMHLLLTVHDEIVLEAPEHKAEAAHAMVREAMTGTGIKELISVPLRVDSHVVARWGDAK